MKQKKFKSINVGKTIFIVFMIFLVAYIGILLGGVSKTPFIKNNLSPSSRIGVKDITAYQGNLVLNGTFSYTGVSNYSNSMNPTFDYRSKLLLKNFSNNPLFVGDIIYFNVTSANCTKLIDSGTGKPVTHRIIDKNIDSVGVYYSTKGDNNEYADDCKVRKKDIYYIVVGILY